jgi:hypothetical protein
MKKVEEEKELAKTISEFFKRETKFECILSKIRECEERDEYLYKQ